MSATNLLAFITITIIALIVTLFQYFYKAKRTSKKTILFAFFRFITVFTLLLLIYDPKVLVRNSKTIKPKLSVLIDNSASIAHLKQQDNVEKAVKTFQNHAALNDKFEVKYYEFGSQLDDSLALDFEDSQSQIEKALSDLKSINRKDVAATVLISDGNQTLGKSYSFYKNPPNQAIYSVPVGDTTTVADLFISNVNANKYVYLENSFPVEILANYRGINNQKTNLSIYQGKQKVFSQALEFTKDKKSHFVTPIIKATKAGVKKYTISLSPLNNEKNTRNNSKTIVVETIDQKTSTLIVTNVTNPDIAALKRSIETNKRREVQVINAKKFENFTEGLKDTKLVILYQPDKTFQNIYEACKKVAMPTFTVTGKQTDWKFLNAISQNYSKKALSNVQEVLPILNENFEIFDVTDFDFTELSPLESTFGEVQLQSFYQSLFFKKIAGVDTNNPLFAFWNNDIQSEAVLFGEGIWRWRMDIYKRDKNFQQFDDFFGKIIQYLSNKKTRKRLTVNYENTYNTSESILISASYFNKNYEFDSKAKLNIRLKKSGDGKAEIKTMFLKGSFYEVDLSDLEAGNYEFKVVVENTNIATAGNFVIEAFDVEKQYDQPNIFGLQQLATSNNGELVYLDQLDNLIEKLNTDEKYKPILKTSTQEKSLINWHWLLGLLIASLATEWFIRKYNGLI